MDRIATNLEAARGYVVGWEAARGYVESPELGSSEEAERIIAEGTRGKSDAFTEAFHLAGIHYTVGEMFGPPDTEKYDVCRGYLAGYELSERHPADSDTYDGDALNRELAELRASDSEDFNVGVTHGALDHVSTELAAELARV